MTKELTYSQRVRIVAAIVINWLHLEFDTPDVPTKATAEHIDSAVDAVCALRDEAIYENFQFRVDVQREVGACFGIETS